MAHIRKPTYTKPIPAGAVIRTIKGKQVAEWADRRGKLRRATVVQTSAGPKLQFISRIWYVTYTDGKGKRRSRKGYSDRAATEQLAARLEKRVAQKAEGLIDPFEEQHARPLAEHLADFRVHLEGRGNVPRYIHDVIGRLERLFAGCGFEVIPDIEPGKVEAWLQAQRQDERQAPPARKDEWTLTEVAKLLGVKLESVSPLVRRHGLVAIGNGKRRRFPLETVATLLDLRGQGISVETVNQTIGHLKSFCRWLVKDRRTALNPVEHLSGGNADANRKHARRELTLEEMRQLLSNTLLSRRDFRGLNGISRYHLYLVACATGFRASACASLTPGHFDFSDPASPVVMLGIRKDKSRRGKIQPLPVDVAGLLRELVDGLEPGALLWPGTWARDRKGGEMLRLDLADAGIPYVVHGPDGPEYADFHALRHSYLTLGASAGIDLRTLQELAGHSTPLLTARYTHRRRHDLTAAVARMPSLVSGEKGEDQLALQLALETRSSLQPDAVGCTDSQHGQDSTQEPQPPDSSASCSDLQQGAESCRRVSEGTRTPDVQIHSLALSDPNIHSASNLRLLDPSACAPACARFDPGGDTRLQQIVEAWDSLPSHIQSSILALVNAGQQKRAA